MILMFCIGAIKLEAEAGHLAPDEGTMCMFKFVKIPFNFLPPQDLKLYFFFFFFCSGCFARNSNASGEKRLE